MIEPKALFLTLSFLELVGVILGVDFLFPSFNLPNHSLSNSILELFRKRDQIDIFNKKALYIYIHEMVPEAKTPRITKIANSLYDVFKRNYVFYLENSYIKFT